MCKALEDLYNEGVDEGIEKGIEKGIEQGIVILIKTCKEFGLSKEEILKRIIQEFKVTEEYADRYLSHIEA